MTTNRRYSARGLDLFKTLVALALFTLLLLLLRGQGFGLPLPLLLSLVPTQTPVPAVLDRSQPAAEGSSVTLSGRGQPGTMLEVLAGEAVVGRTTVSPDGTWSLDAALPPGDYQLRARLLDAGGAVLGESAPMALTVPAAVPVPSLAAPQFMTDSITLSGTAAPGANVEVVSGDQMLGAATAGEDGAWSLTTVLAPGSYQLVARTVDAAGGAPLESAALALEVPAVSTGREETKAARPPTLDSPQIGASGAVTLTGTGTPGTAVDILSDGTQVITAVVDAGGTWTAVVPAGAGGAAALSVQNAGDPASRSAAATVELPEPAALALAAQDQQTEAAATLTETETITAGGTLSPAAGITATGTLSPAAGLTATQQALGRIRSTATAPPEPAEPTATARATATPTAAQEDAVEETPAAVEGERATPTRTAAARATATPTSEQTATQTATAQPTATPSPTSTPTQEPEPTSTPTPVPVATATPVSGLLLPTVTPTPAATAAPPTATAAPAAESGEGQVHIVEAGDSLSGLALEYLGDLSLYPLIVEATNAKAAEDPTFTPITDPNQLEVGQKLWIPAAPEP